MATKAPKQETTKNIIVAKTDDGTVQITFTIPYADIARERTHVEKELIKDVEVAGFRKGKAPLEKALEKIPESSIIEHTLQYMLPRLLGQAMTEHRLRLALYPKFELIKANQNEDWEVRAISAEFPEVALGNYKETLRLRLKETLRLSLKEKIAAEARTSTLWTPDKGKNEKKLTTEQKQQLAIKALLEHVEIKIPRLLIEEETNSRLSQLLERIEKLGLTLDSYIASVGKTPDSLRHEYEKQAKETLSLDFILNKISDTESLTVEKKEVDSAIEASKADRSLAEKLETPEQRRILESILRKRKALEYISSLIGS